MHVLQINKLYDPWVGGIEKVVQDIAEGLNGKIDMEVLACQPKGKGCCEFVNGVPVTRTGSFGILFSMPISLSFPFLLRKLSKNKDVLHFHTPFPLGVISYLLVRPKGKLVLWWHSDIVKQKNALRFYKPFLLHFLKIADKIIVATDQHIEHSNFLREFKNKCEVIPFGIDIKKFSMNNEIHQKVSEINRKYSDKIVLFVGRLIYYKGVEFLIRAMKDVEGKLLLVGQGSLEKKLLKTVNNLGLGNKISFLGKVQDRDMLAYYHACSVFVLPSIANSEAFGIVQLEAMACGKPVINTSIPTGAPCVSIDGETGITVPPKDASRLAKAINLILDDKDLRNRYGDNAFMRVQQNFSLEKMNDRVHLVYKNLMM